jgi:phosphonopyruvate decarboxylase
LDNGAHDSTGGQATVSRHVSFAGIAAACGYPCAIEGDDVSLIDTLFSKEPNDDTRRGPRFARLMIRRGTPEGLPRPTISPADVKARLMRHIGAV